MPGSTNDSRMLRRLSLHHLAMHGNLFDRVNGDDGFSPFLIGDSGYPLLPWLMVPHRGPWQLSLAQQLFNRRLRRGRCVVENAFGILKQTFRELLVKSQFHITFLPDVIVSCAILHNVLLGQSHEDIKQLLEVLRTEGLDGKVIDDDVGQGDADNPNGDDVLGCGDPRFAGTSVYISPCNGSKVDTISWCVFHLSWFFSFFIFDLQCSFFLGAWHINTFNEILW